MGAVVGLSFCAGLAQDLHGRVEEQADHLNRDDKVGPTGVEPIDRHSGIAASPAHQDQHRGDIGGERKKTDHA